MPCSFNKENLFKATPFFCLGKLCFNKRRLHFYHTLCKSRRPLTSPSVHLGHKNIPRSFCRKKWFIQVGLLRAKFWDAIHQDWQYCSTSAEKGAPHLFVHLAPQFSDRRAVLNQGSHHLGAEKRPRTKLPRGPFHTSINGGFLNGTCGSLSSSPSTTNRKCRTAPFTKRGSYLKLLPKNSLRPPQAGDLSGSACQDTQHCNMARLHGVHRCPGCCHHHFPVNCPKGLAIVGGHQSPMP